ncbi:hypothetical protein C8R46DRAFT_1218356 [Mycena filopes]|nr:hypothetical protein C8R46DRAFT_1218356 [Mycena filopes]
MESESSTDPAALLAMVRNLEADNHSLAEELTALRLEAVQRRSEIHRMKLEAVFFQEKNEGLEEALRVSRDAGKGHPGVELAPSGWGFAEEGDELDSLEEEQSLIPAIAVLADSSENLVTDLPSSPLKCVAEDGLSTKANAATLPEDPAAPCTCQSEMGLELVKLKSKVEALHDIIYRVSTKYHAWAIMALLNEAAIKRLKAERSKSTRAARQQNKKFSELAVTLADVKIKHNCAEEELKTLRQTCAISANGLAELRQKVARAEGERHEIIQTSSQRMTDNDEADMDSEVEMIPNAQML